MWVCVDGTEGVGKTTLTADLVDGLPATGINEFSDAPFGDALRDAVTRNPHYISNSRIGQSLVFLGDFMELYESSIRPKLDRGQMVITDRGWLSKYAYQSTVLQDVMTSAQAASLLDTIMAYIPKPDLTVLLDASPPVVRARLIERDGRCSDGRLAFIERAAEEARSFEIRAGDLPAVVVDADLPRDAVLAQALTAIRVAISAKV